MDKLFDVTTIDDCETKRPGTVVFIGGYCKQSNWDVSEHGKALNILQQLKKHANLIVVQLTDLGYQTPLSEVCTSIMTRCKLDKKYMIVGHSYGCFFAQQLAIADPLVGAVLLFNRPSPTMPTCNT